MKFLTMLRWEKQQPYLFKAVCATRLSLALIVFLSDVRS